MRRISRRRSSGPARSASAYRRWRAGLETEIAQLQAQIKLQSERLEVARKRRDAGRAAELQRLHDGCRVPASPGRGAGAAAGAERSDPQLAAKQNQLTETRFSLKQLPTLMAQKVQTLAQRAVGDRAAHGRDQGPRRLRDPRADRRPRLDAAGHRRPERRSATPPARDHPRGRRASGGAVRAGAGRSASSRRDSRCASSTTPFHTSISARTAAASSRSRRPSSDELRRRRSDQAERAGLPGHGASSAPTSTPTARRLPFSPTCF